MAQPIAARAAQRGFPAFDFAGQSGQGALPDSTAPPPAAGLPGSPWTNPASDPASVPAALPAPQDYIGVTMWGLPAAANPDNTPRTHAGPFADPAQLALGDTAGTHGPVFNGPQVRQPQTSPTMLQGRLQGQGSAADTLQPLTGQIRAMGGYDAVQGYGGGGPGPGGVNTPQGPTTDDLTFGGNTYHNVMVSAGEVPFLVPAVSQFIATAPELPPYAPSFDGPTAAVQAQGVIAADTPATGPPLATPVPAYAASFWS